ncbi:MAG: hypothetical protein L0Z62_46710 [Gemmataceae bacterium]|nr:hypothetical protein [Gemmataceae bacterium]
MNPLTRVTFAGLIGALLIGAVSARPLRADESPVTPPKSAHTWTLEEAQKQLQLCPRDSYLQYVVLQLARREGKLAEVASAIHKARGGQPEPLSLFSGALALQEGMQFEILSGGAHLKVAPAEPCEPCVPAVAPGGEIEMLPPPTPYETGSGFFGLGSLINQYSSDPNVRMEELLFQSEELRQIHDEMRRFWMNDQPSHMTYQRVHGGISPEAGEVLPMPLPEQDEPTPMPPPEEDSPSAALSATADGTPILPPIPPGTTPMCEDTPDRFTILSTLRSAGHGVPYLLEEFYDDITLAVEKLVDRIDPPCFFPLVGLAQLHHRQFKCTAYFTETVEGQYPFPFQVKKRRVETIYLDRDHLHLVACTPEMMRSLTRDLTELPEETAPPQPEELPMPQEDRDEGDQTAAPGERIEWSHCWTPSAAQVFQDNPQMGTITLSNEAGQTGDSFIVAPAPQTAAAQTPVIETGQTLPSGWYLRHSSQNTPPAPDCPLPRELSNLLDATTTPAEPKEEPLPQAEILKVVPARVPVSTLKGPQIKRHNWEARLKGKPRPEVSALSRCVPHNFYLVEFRSVARMLDLLDSADQWITFFYNQSVHDARTQDVAARLQTQLAVKGDVAALRPFYDLVVEEVALTGSDLFVREGSDVTLLFRYRNEKLFRQHMDGLLVKAKAHPGAKRYTGRMLDVDYVHVETPDRTIRVYSAYPELGLHVRSNSKVGLKRVLEAIRGQTAQGKPVRRLGETLEFLHARSLMPHGAAEEDGFLYLSEAFARHLASPTLKIAELRRLKAYNHLRMIGHAALMYRTEQGKAPDSLEALAESDCCAGPFNEGDLAAPGDGRYTLADGGLTGICSRFGTARFLTPCCEIPIKEATAEEAAAYQGFVEKHAQDWRGYFTPLAVRAKVRSGQIRLEAAVLSLTGSPELAMIEKFIGGPPEHLDALPVPKRNLFSINVRLNKEALLKELGNDIEELEFLGACAGDETETGELAGTLLGLYLQGPATATAAALGIAEVEKELGRMRARADVALLAGLPRFLRKGIGNQIGLHVYDQDVPFDLNLASLLGQGLAALEGHKNGLGMESLGVLAIAVPVAGLTTTPVYLSVTVQDGRIVDDYLDRLDKVVPGLVHGLAELCGDSIRPVNGVLQPEFYKVTLKGGVQARSLSLRIGPARYRIHWARIGRGLYIANQLAVLEDIQAADLASRRHCCIEVGARRLDRGPKAHAMIRMRARNWDQALPGFKLSWAENNRQACLCNLAPLSSAARALTAPPPGQESKTASWDVRMDRVQDHAARIDGARHFCPEGGRYELSKDGKSVTCSVHGSMLDPRQPAAPADDSPTGRLMSQFGDFTAALTFTPEGPRVVVTIDRK